MKNILLISLLFLLLSCNSNKRRMEYYICKDSIEYWDCIPDSNYNSNKFGFGFRKGGNVCEYIIENGFRWIIGESQEISNCEKWSVTEDSIFTKKCSNTKIVFYMKMKILKCTTDTILGKSLNSKGQILLLRIRGLKKIIKPGDPMYEKRGKNSIHLIRL